jgi:hypothetical protein
MNGEESEYLQISTNSESLGKSIDIINKLNLITTILVIKTNYNFSNIKIETSLNFNLIDYNS